VGALVGEEHTTRAEREALIESIHIAGKSAGKLIYRYFIFDGRVTGIPIRATNDAFVVCSSPTNLHTWITD
jgi:hypothetical protein